MKNEKNGIISLWQLNKKGNYEDHSDGLYSRWKNSTDLDMLAMKHSCNLTNSRCWPTEANRDAIIEAHYYTGKSRLFPCCIKGTGSSGDWTGPRKS